MKNYRSPHSKMMLVISNYPLSNHDSVGKSLFACNGSMGSILPFSGPIFSWSIWICWKTSGRTKTSIKINLIVRYQKWPYLKKEPPFPNHHFGYPCEFSGVYLSLYGFGSIWFLSWVLPPWNHRFREDLGSGTLETYTWTNYIMKLKQLHHGTGYTQQLP